MPGNTLHILPEPNESPTVFADRLGLAYAKSVSGEHKKTNGQFFTPVEIARCMAKLSTFEGEALSLLDPGTGTAILTCALVEHLIQNPKLKAINIVSYETDLEILDYTKKSLDYLQEWAKGKGVELVFCIITDDFILENAEFLSGTKKGMFDIAISNPPYFKLPKDDPRVQASMLLVNGQPNIYALFMGIAAKMLKEKGELIFITPRSFASGSYFKAFREFFFNTVTANKIHLFVSRSKTFKRDKVLQETVIIRAEKKPVDPDGIISIASSSGISDIDAPIIKYFKFRQLVDLHSGEKILYLPSSDREEEILNLTASWNHKLSDHNIQVSTGPVVAFRATDYIRETYKNGKVISAPLFWLHNISKMSMEHPKQIKGKGQYIRVEPGSKSLVLPNKDYILLRRFSTKDDKSRLIASPYFADAVNGDFIGVENKVNYIYRKGGELSEPEIIGLCALLNSEVFDIYFQMFNGNVNVSATELREMNVPDMDTILEIGTELMVTGDLSMENVNATVNNALNFENALYE